MENLAHTLTGWAIARAGNDRGRELPAVAMVGANLPDIDLVWSLTDPLDYLDHHRGWTHSVAGTLLLAVLLAIVVDVVARGRRSPGQRRRLFLISFASVSSHLLMDATNAYGIRWGWPWSDAWSHHDLWFIVDPWLWLLLGGAALLARPLEARARTLAVAAAAVLALPVLLVDSVSTVARGAWIVAAVAIVAALLLAPQRWRRPATARLGLVAMVAYALVAAAVHGRALDRLAEERPVDSGEVERAALPQPMTLLRWRAVVAGEEAIETGALDVRGDGIDWTRIERGGDEPLAEAALAGEDGARVLHFTRFPVVRVEDGRVVVRDLRFVGPDGSGFGAFVLEVKADAGLDGPRGTGHGDDSAEARSGDATLDQPAVETVEQVEYLQEELPAGAPLVHREGPPQP